MSSKPLKQGAAVCRCRRLQEQHMYSSVLLKYPDNDTLHHIVLVMTWWDVAIRIYIDTYTKRYREGPITRIVLIKSI